jgi:hypothetical protein
MEIAILKGGVVDTVAVFDDEQAAVDAGLTDYVILDGDRKAEPGDTWDGSHFSSAYTAPSPTAEMVLRERDRRGTQLMFDGQAYLLDGSERELGIAALQSGAKAGDTQWLADGVDFSYGGVTMDAVQMSKLAFAAAKQKHMLGECAQQLLAMSPIPEDYTDDKYWSAP